MDTFSSSPQAVSQADLNEHDIYTQISFAYHTNVCNRRPVSDARVFCDNTCVTELFSSSLFERRFLLPEYLPYAGIFHERGQPGLATHSSVNRVLAGTCKSNACDGEVPRPRRPVGPPLRGSKLNRTSSRRSHAWTCDATPSLRVGVRRQSL